MRCAIAIGMGLLVLSVGVLGQDLDPCLELQPPVKYAAWCANRETTCWSSPVPADEMWVIDYGGIVTGDGRVWKFAVQVWDSGCCYYPIVPMTDASATPVLAFPRNFPLYPGMRIGGRVDAKNNAPPEEYGFGCPPIVIEGVTYPVCTVREGTFGMAPVFRARRYPAACAARILGMERPAIGAPVPLAAPKKK